ncbi:hypothetical protein AX15_005525 [Amanita polypyramis BW_CC]|nr:hypothetical protein AX15_005525 [Amanita polypyramis BW_CC]
MDYHERSVLVRSAGFCFGIAGYILSVLSAIISAVVTVDRKAPLIADGDAPVRPVVRIRKGRSKSSLTAREKAIVSSTPSSPKPPPIAKSKHVRLVSHRRSRSIPTITMTHADDDDADTDSAGFLHVRHNGSLPPIEAVLYAEPLSYVNEDASTGLKPPLNRSLSSPQLTAIPASPFLRPPARGRPGKKKILLRKMVKIDASQKPRSLAPRARTQPYEPPYNLLPPGSH